MKKKSDKKLPLVLSVIALVLAVIALINSFNSGAITGHATSQTDITYNSGYVGIGVNNPSDRLHVGNGDALFEDDVIVEDNLEVYDNADLGTLFVQGDSFVGYVNATELYVSGNVTIDGDLIADNLGGSSDAGEIILDVLDSAPTCDSSSRGLIYLDNSTSPPQMGVCYDSTWVYASLAPPVA